MLDALLEKEALVFEENEIAEALHAVKEVISSKIVEDIVSEEAEQFDEAWSEQVVQADSAYAAVNYWLLEEEDGFNNNYYRKDSENGNEAMGVYACEVHTAEMQHSVVEEIAEVKHAKMLGFSIAVTPADHYKEEARKVFKMFDQTFTFVMYELVK